MRNEYASASFSEQIAQSLALFEHLRSRGVVRDDIDVRKQVYMLDAITMGFLVIDEYMPDDFKYSDEEIVEMTAEAVERVFAPSPSSVPRPDKKKKQEIANTLISSLEYIISLSSGLAQ